MHDATQPPIVPPSDPNVASATLEPITLEPPTSDTLFRPSILESYSFIFRCEHWMMTLVVGGVAVFLQGLIPVVPLMFLTGYVAYLVEQQIRFPSQTPIEFNFDHLGKYLTRGLWPKLAEIVLSIVIMLPVIVPFMVILFATPLLIANGGQGDPVSIPTPLIALGIGGYLFVFYVAIALATALIGLLCFRSAMAGSFAEAFKLGWALHFARTCFAPLFIGMLAWFLINFVLSILGLLCLCIGVYLTTAWSTIALMHYIGQCYRLFLLKGGEPIMITPDTALEGRNS